jgi:formate C-acetyltransferase
MFDESVGIEETGVFDSRLRRLTPRARRLQERAREGRFIRKEMWAEKLSVLNEDTRKEPLIVRKALAFNKVLSEMPVEIKQDELVVGRVRIGRAARGLPFPEYETEAEKREAARIKTSRYSVWGHSLPGYPSLLEKGLVGIREEANARLRELTQRDKDKTKQDFYRAVVICCDGIRILARRYADLAVSLVEKEKDDSRRQELLEIARVCRSIPDNPIQSFREALQTCWFTYLALHSTLNHTPLGRFDQYMYSFLKSDLENGDLTLGQAQELIDCFWIKLNERSQSTELCVEDYWVPSMGAFGGYDREKDSRVQEVLDLTWQQNVVLGGQDTQGKDATNLVTYLCLNATQKLHMTQPYINMRFFKDSSPVLLRRSCEVLRDGYGMPIVFNDEVIIPAFQKLGIPLQDARDYANDGCWETLIAGKTELRYTQLCALRCLERALNRGYGRMSGEKEGLETRDPHAFTSFQEVMDAFRAQLDCEIRKIIDLMVTYYGCLYDIAPVPFLSSLMEDCLREGKDVTEGGARYVIHALLLMGLSNVADSLAAIKKLVFEDEVISWSELLKSLADNFADKEDLRQTLITRAPKYGTDCDYVDELARGVLDYFVQRVKHHDQSHGDKKIGFSTGAGTFESYIAAGERVGATPDGRLATTPLGSNLSPSEGRAVKGQTAAINSFTGLNLVDLPTGSPLDLGMEKRVLMGEEGLGRLSALVQSFLDKGGNILTINVHGVEELREAQREPDRYRDLVVRVAGWQAYFVDLPRRYQESIITRIEQYGG